MRGPLAGCAVLVVAATAQALEPVPRARLCISSGAVDETPDHHLSVETGELRAVLRQAPTRVAELRFTYRGPTAKVVPLASGEIRSQFGLKLRAKDTCNILYVMWHFTPKPVVAVAVKLNPGKATHAQCGAQGYRSVTATMSRPIPAPVPGTPHTLKAALTGTRLDVWVDGALAWQGMVPPEAFTFDGPIGLRSDNARLTFDLFTDPPAPGTADLPCRGERGAGD